YAKDGYFDVLLDKIEWILSVIEASLDDRLMIWSDVDIVFNSRALEGGISNELELLTEGKDLLFQSEFPEGGVCNTGFQVIRRNTRTLIFYAQVRLMLEVFDRNEQVCVNHLLQIIDGVEWGYLPVEYSNGSNGGLSDDSKIYHAT